MTRRLVLAILSTTAAAVLLVGLGTALLVTRAARQLEASELRRQARALANGVTDTSNGRRDLLLPATRQVLIRVLRLEDASVVVVRDNATVAGTLPTTVRRGPAQLIVAMKPGQTISGQNLAHVWAAAAVSTSNGTGIVVLTSKATRPRGLYGWLALSSGVTLAIATAVAVFGGRRLSRPIANLDAAAHAIAAGQLSTRLPEPPATDNDELADLTRSVNTMAASLERSRSLEQQFLLSISHDLRTPLTSIRGYAEAITDGATNDPRWAASVIGSESRRLERLVRDLLELAKLQARGFSLSMERIDLTGAAISALEGVAPDAANAAIALSAQCGAPVWMIGDRDRLGQVLANLIENAMKYANGHVAIGTATQEGVAMVWVDDDGPGIPAEDRAHVFERMYVTTREPRRKEIGSGLGLAIVNELVHAMHGTVTAEAAPSGGARMVVRLPAA